MIEGYFSKRLVQYRFSKNLSFLFGIPFYKEISQYQPTKFICKTDKFFIVCVYSSVTKIMRSQSIIFIHLPNFKEIL